jgi:hypothetical protein
MPVPEDRVFSIRIKQGHALRDRKVIIVKAARPHFIKSRSDFMRQME